MTIYLASPFFTTKEKKIKSLIKEKLINLGFDIIDPQPPTSNSGIGWEQTNAEWGRNTWEKDVKHIDIADAVIAIDWGMYSDTGTAWEIGYAFCSNKPCIVVSPNVALNTNHSLMVINGATTFVTERRFLSFTEEEIEEAFHKEEAFMAKGVVQN